MNLRKRDPYEVKENDVNNEHRKGPDSASGRKNSRLKEEMGYKERKV
jgi:hypothetical protein